MYTQNFVSTLKFTERSPKMIQLETLDVTLLLVFLTTVLAVKYVQDCLNDCFNSIPGPIGIPFLGYLPFMASAKDQLQKFQELRERFGNIFSLNMANNKIVVISGKDEIRDAVARSDYFSDRPGGLTVDLVGGGVGFAKFSPSYILRKKVVTSVIGKMYTHNPDGKLAEIITREIQQVCSEMKKHQGNPFDLHPYIYEAVGHIIWQMCYGRGISGRNDESFKFLLKNNREFSEFNKVGNPFDAMPFLRHFMPKQFEYYINLLQGSNKYRDEYIKKHEETFDPDDLRDICDGLISAKNNLTSKQIELLQKSELTVVLADLVGAGFDSVTSSILWAVMFLTENPEVQTHAQKQIDKVISSSPKISHMKDLPYIEAIILETLRLGVIVPFLLPHAPTENVMFRGYPIPKEATILLNSYSVCFDETLWDEPTNFKPERFLTKTGKINKEKCEWIFVFGVGRRKCLGEQFAKMEIFMFITSLLQNFKFKKPIDAEYTLNGQFGLIHWPQRFKIIVEDRS